MNAVLGRVGSCFTAIGLLACLVAPFPIDGASAAPREVSLREGTFLLSRGNDLILVDPDAGLRTRIGGLQPEHLAVDSLGRVVFASVDTNDDSEAFISTLATIFRYDPDLRVLEKIAQLPDFSIVVELVLESDSSLLVGSSFERIDRIDLDTGAISLVTQGGLVAGFRDFAVDPTDGSIVAVTPSGVFRADSLTGVQSPVIPVALNNTSRVVVDSSGAIFVWNDTGGLNNQLSRVDVGVQELDPIATFFRMTEISLDENEDIVLVGSPGLLEPGAYVRVDPDTGESQVIAPASGVRDFVFGSSSEILSALSASLQDRNARSVLSSVDLEAGSESALFFAGLIANENIVGTVVRRDGALIALSNSLRPVLLIDPADHSVSELPTGGLLQAPENPVEISTGEIAVVDPVAGGAFALAPDGSARVIGAGNLIDVPTAVIEEPPDSFLVGSTGFRSPGLVRVSQSGLQEPVLVGEAVLDLAPSDGGRVLALDSTGDVVSVDRQTGSTQSLDLGTDIRVEDLAKSSGDTYLLVTDFGPGASGIVRLDESSGGIVDLVPERVSPNVHLHAVDFTQSDLDLDGVPDGADNCIDVPNPDQADANSLEDDDSSLPGVQHYGDACDADLNEDGLVAPDDFFSGFRPCLGRAVGTSQQCAEAEFNGDEVVAPDEFFGVFRPSLGGPPGPGVTE